MITVLVVPKGAGVVLREEWELAGRDEPHVDYVTDDLTEFLRGIVCKSVAACSKRYAVAPRGLPRTSPALVRATIA